MRRAVMVKFPSYLGDRQECNMTKDSKKDMKLKT